MGHKAADCQHNRKCRECGEASHLACACLSHRGGRIWGDGPILANTAPLVDAELFLPIVAPPVSAKVDVPEVTEPINSMDAEDSHVSSGGSPSVPKVKVTRGPSGVSLLAAVEGMDGIESENESVVDNVTLDNDENIAEESSTSMENANEINVVKDNVINVVKDNVTNVVKEKGTNVVKEKGTNVVKKGTNAVKEKGTNVVKENGINVVKENGINVVKENGINVVKENEINVETSDLGSQESGSMECRDSLYILSFSSSSKPPDSLDQLLAVSRKRSKHAIIPSAAVAAASIVKRSKAVPGAGVQKKKGK